MLPVTVKIVSAAWRAEMRKPEVSICGEMTMVGESLTRTAPAVVFAHCNSSASTCYA